MLDWGHVEFLNHILNSIPGNLQLPLPELATPIHSHPLRQRRKPRPQDEVCQLLAHHFSDPDDGGGGPGVHVHNPGEVADDEVDPGVAR